MKIPRIIKIPEVKDSRGVLAFFESNKHIPLIIKNTSIFTNLEIFKNNSLSLENMDQFLIVLSGLVEIRVNNGAFDNIFKLDEPNIGLYVSKTAEINIINFNPGTILLVLS